MKSAIQYSITIQREVRNRFRTPNPITVIDIRYTSRHSTAGDADFDDAPPSFFSSQKERGREREERAIQISVAGWVAAVLAS